MTAADPPADRSGAPAFPAAAGTALVTAAATVLAALRPWGDTGVTPSGTFDDATPVPTVVLLAAAAVAAAAAVVVSVRGVRRARRTTVAAVALVLGLVALGSTLAVTTAQVLPRDGGWWGLVASAGSAATGLVVLAVPAVRARGPRARRVVRTVATLVPLAVLVAGGVVAPGWAGHVVDGTYPDTASRSPEPTTVTRIGWRAQFGPDAVTAVLGGRLVVVEDGADDGTCRLRVRALDLGTGDAVWSSTRPARCDGPAVTAVDGNDTVVRVVLRGPRDGDRAFRSSPTTLYLGTADGRDVTPSADLDAVRWWADGFGLVADADAVRGLDPRTGVTTWSREVPRCDDGARATLQVPAALGGGTRLQARGPDDSPGAVPGTRQVVGTGREVVLSLRCGGSPRVWVVDVLGTADDDRVVTVPVDAVDGAPTTFLPWQDTVVAVLPTALDAGTVAAATLVGVDLAAGAVRWIRPVGRPATATVSPTDGAVSVAVLTGATSADGARTTVLDVRDGTVRAGSSGPRPVASVALAQARLDLVPGGVTAASGDASRTVEVPGCPPDVTGGAAALLAGPGGVVVRCAGRGDAGVAAVGLVP